MKAVILSAKKKENLFPFSESTPTGLLPVNGEPIVSQTVEKLKNQGIDEIYIVVNYKQKMFDEYFSEDDQVKTVFQDKLSGTAEAVNTCNFIEEDFLVINGDVIVSEEDISSLIDLHSSDLSLLATDDSKPEKFGVLSIENNNIVSLDEKPEDPENSLVNSGIYVFSSSIFDKIDSSDQDNLTDVIVQNLDSLNPKFSLIEDYWLDIGSAKKLWEADKILRERDDFESAESVEVHETAYVEESVELRDGVVVEAGAIIKGNSTVCEDSVIGANTVIEDSTIGSGCNIRHSDVCNSLIFSDTVIEPFVSIEQSILGEDSEIRSGTVIKESFIGSRSFIDMNNSIRGVKFVPGARTDLSEISK